MMRFADRQVLVTGSTRGIGHAVALRLLDEGASVVLHGRTPGDTEAAAGPLRKIHGARVRAAAADLTDRDQCRALCRAAGEIDTLVNCAGVLEDLPLSDIDAGHWRRIMDINLTAPWLLSRELLPGLAARRGVIVNVASDAGLLGYPDHSVYCASKGALIGLTRALAVECGPELRVLCVCPGPVDTDMMRQAVGKAIDPGQARAAWAAPTLVGRVADPSEIAAAIAFAASPDCGFASGNLIVVDGGITAGRKI